jgi:HEAT repeat protein
VASEQTLVRQFGVRALELDALRGLTGGITATHLRRVALTDAAMDAVIEGLADPNPRVRWWCIQVLDHVPDPRALDAIATMLADPIPRVRRIAAHALGCVACKRDSEGVLPAGMTEALTRLAENDPNAKVRNEAALALFCRS